MGNYEGVRVNLTKNQLNELKSAIKNKTQTTLRITKKNFPNEELLHKLFLTAKQKTKTRNAVANNILTDIKHNCL